VRQCAGRDAHTTQRFLPPGPVRLTSLPALAGCFVFYMFPYISDGCWLLTFVISFCFWASNPTSTLLSPQLAHA
jgi:hypothetical protein